MTVCELISVLQQLDPAAVVVLRDIEGYTGLVPATVAAEVQLRVHERKGSLFVSFFDDEVQEIIDSRTTRGEVAVLGVLLV
jgi:hypothetical protein